MSLECASFGEDSFFAGDSILNSLQSVSATTVPSNGDLNPYGVAFVPQGFPSGGATAAGDVLVANFNNSMNQQGTGTTIVSVSPSGTTLFGTSPLVGLDTALGVLSKGFVIVGNLPVTYPAVTVGNGALQVFNSAGGSPIATITDATLLDSPWDLTIHDQGSKAQIFVSNVLSGTVTRVDVTVTGSGVTVTNKTRIGSAFGHAPNAAAVVVGPTGLAYDADRDTLYVASTADNAIFAISDAGDRTSDAGQGYMVYSDAKTLHGPLGLVLTPEGNLIAANGDAVNAGGTPNDLVEFTPKGILIATHQLDSGNAGGAFGIAITTAKGMTQFAAVDDDLNSLTIWTFRQSFFF